jgi:hypothetical protein
MQPVAKSLRKEEGHHADVVVGSRVELAGGLKLNHHLFTKGRQSKF